MPRTFSVYMLASLSRRLPSFTARYHITRLVHFEQTPNVRAAIERETEIKGWSRQKKIELIESTNAGWLDLSEGWFDNQPQNRSE